MPQNIIDTDFWIIIENARQAAGNNINWRIPALRVQLDQLSLAQIQAFDDEFSKYMVQAYRWDLWGAAYLMNCGCGDDGFTDFRYWLISEGKCNFDKFLTDPDLMADLPYQIDFKFSLEFFGYQVSDALEVKGWELNHNCNNTLLGPIGIKWENNQLSSLYPRLAKKYKKNIDFIMSR